MPEDTPDAAVTPVSVIVCDDIRQEISGKQILIGVYSGDIVVPSVPIILALCFWIRIIRKNNCAERAKIRVTDPSGNISGETEISFLPSASDPSEGINGAISMPALPISITQTGKISVYWSSNDEKGFSLIGTKRVLIGPVATVSTAHS